MKAAWWLEFDRPRPIPFLSFLDQTIVPQGTMRPFPLVSFLSIFPFSHFLPLWQLSSNAFSFLPFVLPSPTCLPYPLYAFRFVYHKLLQNLLVQKEPHYSNLSSEEQCLKNGNTDWVSDEQFSETITGASQWTGPYMTWNWHKVSLFVPSGSLAAHPETTHPKSPHPKYFHPKAAHPKSVHPKSVHPEDYSSHLQ